MANCMFGGKCLGGCGSPVFAEVLVEAKLKPVCPQAEIELDGQFERFGQEIGRVTDYHHHCQQPVRPSSFDHSTCPRRQLSIVRDDEDALFLDQARANQIDAARELISYLASPPTLPGGELQRRRREADLLERFQRFRSEAEARLEHMTSPETVLCRGMAKIKLVENKLVVANKIEVPTLHISCRSDRVDGEPMAGLVVWATKAGKSQGETNGVRWKSGYIYLRKSASIQHIQGEGQVHGPLFKSLFDKHPSELDYVCSGFAYQNGKWSYNSSVFNCTADGWHDTNRGMSPLEKHYVVAAIAQWMCKGKQNCPISDI